jgi:hypothetical protein
MPLQCNSRHVLLCRYAARPVDLTPVEEDTDGSAEANQDGGNAKHRDHRYPGIIFQEVTSAYAREKSDNDERNDT